MREDDMARRKKGESETFRLSDEEAEMLAREGAAPGLTKSAARFHALMGRAVGGKQISTPDQKTIHFLSDFDKHMRELARSRGIQIREE